MPNFVTGTPGTAAVAGVGKEPSPAIQIKLCPVVTACIVFIDAHTALPPCRNAANTAKLNEQQCLQAAVAPKVHGAEFTDMINLEIIPHKAVGYASRHKSINPPCLFHRAFRTLGQFRCQGFQVRSEGDKGRLFRQILLRRRQCRRIQRCFRRRLMERVCIVNAAVVAVTQMEILPLIQLLPPPSRPCTAVPLGYAIRLALQKCHIALLTFFQRKRQVRQILSRHKAIRR